MIGSEKTKWEEISNDGTIKKTDFLQNEEIIENTFKTSKVCPLQGYLKSKSHIDVDGKIKEEICMNHHMGKCKIKGSHIEDGIKMIHCYCVSENQYPETVYCTLESLMKDDSNIGVKLCLKNHLGRCEYRDSHKDANGISLMHCKCRQMSRRVLKSLSSGYENKY